MVPDPRNLLPSRADPEHRSHRKQLEKEHPFSFKQAVILGLIGLKVAWNIEQQVQKHEEKHEREEAEQKKREDRDRRRRERRSRSEYRGSDSGNGNGKRDGARGGSDSGRRERDGGRSMDGGGQGIEYGRREEPRGYDSRRRMSVAGYQPEPAYQLSHGYRDVRPRGDPRDDPRYYPKYAEPRYDPRYDDRAYYPSRGRSRRDSF
ncbi:hypothetical protein F5Y16DRAFT_401323 [Xylariaceae sp. FL0255]|nr:hypothetical protein F5Y16DRAFT_401323 [Xylariaceae sp. FL0255]